MHALPDELAGFDARADSIGLTSLEWSRRYAVEVEMIFILKCEEIYWQQRGQQKWVLEEDAST